MTGQQGPATGSPQEISRANLILLSLAFAKLILHLAVNTFGAYGYFRDEFYYLACTEHLGAGYVDQPPLSIYLLALSRLVLGDSLVALRLLPAVAGAVTVYLSGLLARELGGRTFAQTLAAVAALASPIFLGMNSIYSMNAFDILCWAVTGLVVVRLVKSPSPRLWMLLGAILGLGLLNKVGVLWLGLGLGVGFLLTPMRTWLKTPWPWSAALIAVIIFHPYVVWNVHHDFPHIEFIRNATGEKYSSLTPARFITEQFLINNPLAVPLWLAGVWFFFRSNIGSRFRVLGWVYVAAFLVLIINGHSKAEYLSPAYTFLFAGGAVMTEHLIEVHSWRWLKPVAIGTISLSSAILSPLVLQELPVEMFIRYSEALGIRPGTAENKRLEKLPQFYADMFGWETLAATVISVYKSLTPEEQASCIIYTQNYGEAGAISFFGKRFGVPRVVSGHNSYFLWGPGEKVPDVVIIVGGRKEDHLRSFESVEEVATQQCEYCMPYENNLPIYVAKRLKGSLKDVWPQTKNFS